ncbi:hypothetical protein ABK040_010613 [Willaertia magna]
MKESSSLSDDDHITNEPSQQQEEVKEQEEELNKEYKIKKKTKKQLQKEIEKQTNVNDILSDEQIETTIHVLEQLTENKYLLSDLKLSKLVQLGSSLFTRKLTKEEKFNLRKNLSKEKKEKERNHDQLILMKTAMKQKKQYEVKFIKEQLRMIPNAPNSDVLMLEEEKLGDDEEKVREEEEPLIEKVEDDGFVCWKNNSTNGIMTVLEGEKDVNGNGEEQEKENNEPLTLKRPIRCYICHEKQNKVHFFYHKMCPKCGDFNFQKRNQKVDLSGRICFVTGGRIKIGYQTTLMLLRNNAELVIVTTRFPKDAAARFAEEPDFHLWKDKLRIYGLDFKHIPSVVTFIEFLKATLPRLDILINNAAQTIRKPPAYYEHVARKELTTSIQHLPDDQKDILGKDYTMKYSNFPPSLSALQNLSSMKKIHTTNHNIEENIISLNTNNSLTLEYEAMKDNNSNVSASSIISQLPLLEEDKFYNENEFPREVFDVNKQQADLRDTNTWLQHLDEVPIMEMLEVQTINVTAPFLFNSKLKSLLLKAVKTNGISFIVNVSAMEGQFYRRSKQVTHPHLNMAKASLNMMTRTSGSDYAKDGIYMTSVDTGWNNDENPLNDLENISQSYFCPLDEIDGAARILDPIACALSGERKYFGCFLKNFEPFRW